MTICNLFCFHIIRIDTVEEIEGVGKIDEMMNDMKNQRRERERERDEENSSIRKLEHKITYLHVLFHTPQHVRLQCLLQLLHLRRLLQIAKLLQEVVERAEILRIEEIEESPQLLRIVLEGSTGEEEEMLEHECLQLNEQLRILILQSMSFVNDEILPAGNEKLQKKTNNPILKRIIRRLPVDFGEESAVRDDHLICGDHNIELEQLLLLHAASFLRELISKKGIEEIIVGGRGAKHNSNSKYSLNCYTLKVHS